VKKNILTLLLLLGTALLISSITLHAEDLSGKTLQNDLNYYRKVTKDKNLNKNDRYYILLRIEEKYENTDIDLAALQNEIKTLKSEPMKAPEPEETEKKPEKTGSVNKLYISETEETSKIIIETTSAKKSNSFLLRDPDPGKPPKLVLDLYDAEDNLSKKAKEIKTKNGIFSRVRAGQFETEPDKIVRIIAEMREDRPYKIKKEGENWIIEAKKKTGKKTSENAAPVLPAKPASEPAAPAPAESTEKERSLKYKIEVGDVISIDIAPAEELSRKIIVQEDGNISFPLIGVTKARGLSTTELEKNIKEDLSKYVSNPKVTVTIKEFSRRQVFITGEVNSVGSFNYKDDMRLLEFISSIGGFKNDADRKEIKIYRGPSTKRKLHTVNAEEIIESGNFSKDFMLEPGDIIEVSKGSEKVSVLGEIKKPGYYDWDENMTLLNLVSKAGGFSDEAKLKKLNIIRIEKDKDGNEIRKIIRINLNKILTGKGPDVPLSPADTIYIPKRSLARANWFVNNIMPWLSLAAILIAISGGV
jgi:polysaccharide export outer membrane protein